MKNAVFLDVAPCTSCVNRCFEGTYRLHLQGRKIRERGTSVSRCLHPLMFVALQKYLHNITLSWVSRVRLQASVLITCTEGMIRIQGFPIFLTTHQDTNHIEDDASNNSSCSGNVFTELLLRYDRTQTHKLSFDKTDSIKMTRLRVRLLLHVFFAAGICLLSRCLAPYHFLAAIGRTHRLMGGIYEVRR
jgi:hypothetical protein